MDVIEQRLRETQYQYADKDPTALGQLRDRVVQTGRRFGLISYTDLVRDVEFHYPNINHGRAHQIRGWEWSGLDRRIVGDCLAYISMESYVEARFMASALVIGRLESRPSDMFFEWMESLGVLPDTREDTVLAFWSDQVRRAHHWYKYGVMP